MATIPDQDYQRIRYEIPADHVARVVLARGEMANAQDKRMLYELNDAFDHACHDDDIKVIIVAADGMHFSSGHDLRDRESLQEFKTVTTWGGFDGEGQEGHFSREEEFYVGFCWRWRNIPKPTMVSVQGKVIAGGLMLVWPFDIVIASEDAEFSDPVVAFGVNAVEYFVHPYEVGARKAKQMLFTGEPLSAAEAHRLGMVNEVVKREELESYTLEMAASIAEQPMMGLKLSKLCVNQALDNMGYWNTIQAAMGYHHLGHASAQMAYQMPVHPAGAERIKRQARRSKEKAAARAGTAGGTAAG